MEFLDSNIMVEQSHQHPQKACMKRRNPPKKKQHGYQKWTILGKGDLFCKKKTYVIFRYFRGIYSQGYNPHFSRHTTPMILAALLLSRLERKITCWNGQGTWTKKDCWMFVSHALMELNCFLQYLNGHRTKNKYKNDSIEVTGVWGYKKLVGK